MKRKIKLITVLASIIFTIQNTDAQDQAEQAEAFSLITNGSWQKILREEVAVKLGEISNYDVVFASGTSCFWVAGMSSKNGYLLTVYYRGDDAPTTLKIKKNLYEELLGLSSNLVNKAKRNVTWLGDFNSFGNYYLFTKNPNNKNRFLSGYIGSPVKDTDSYKLGIYLSDMIKKMYNVGDEIEGDDDPFTPKPLHPPNIDR